VEHGAHFLILYYPRPDAEPDSLPSLQRICLRLQAPASTEEAGGYEQSTATRPLVHAGNRTLEQTLHFLFSASVGGADLHAKLAEHSFGADPEGEWSLGCDATQRWKRIVTVGVSGGGSLTGPLRDARRFPSTRWYLVLGTTRTALGFGICPSFKAFSVAPCRTLKSRFATFSSLYAKRSLGVTQGCCCTRTT
jgi:hypothetical protein